MPDPNPPTDPELATLAQEHYRRRFVFAWLLLSLLLGALATGFVLSLVH